MPIQILLLFVLVVATIITWRRMHERVIRFGEAFAWTIVWVVAGIAVLLPETTSVVARWVGVGRGADLVLYASVITLFLLVFKAFSWMDSIEKNITDLVRRDALRDLPEQQKKIEEKNPPVV